MTAERLVKLLEQLDTKWAALASQAKEARDRAQQTLEMAESLRQELTQIQKQILSTAVTQMTPRLSTPHETK